MEGPITAFLLCTFLHVSQAVCCRYLPSRPPSRTPFSLSLIFLVAPEKGGNEGKVLWGVGTGESAQVCSTDR